MSIVVEDNQDTANHQAHRAADPAQALVTWINGYLEPWRQHRDTTHKKSWDQYNRLWRCMWSPEEQNRKTERSKLISPGTMQATDSTIAEIEEAVFGREQWFELDEDLDEITDMEQKTEMIAARDRLRERMDEDDIPYKASTCFVLGAVYGTGIGKINVDVKEYRYLKKDPQTGISLPAERERVCVELIPIEPYEIIPDPATDEIEEMLGIAHETTVPLHVIHKRIRTGKYRRVAVSEWTGGTLGATGDDTQPPQRNVGLVTEWHGLVPAKYLAPLLAGDKLTDDERAMYDVMDESEEMVEAIVTLLNRGELLDAKANPFFMKDRSIIAYQHDQIPNYFWGRGVPEKALMSQKALDAELRSRIDAMALAAHPMMAGDVTRLPRGFNLAVYPGKFWPTTGVPSDVVQPFQIQNANAATFQQSGEFQAMLQGATGAMDPVAALGGGAGATDRAINSSSFIKRARRTMLNIEKRFLKPLVQKCMWRYVQFAPKEFPQDYEFRVKGALGIMAREIEQQQNIQMLSIVPAESPPFMVLLKSIIDNSSNPNKAELVAAIDQLVNPPVDEEAQRKAAEAEALQQRMLVAQVMEQEGKAAKAFADANLSKAKSEQIGEDIANDDEDQQMQAMGLAIDLKEANAFEQQNKNAEMMTQLRAAEIALKAVQAQVSIEKVRLEAKKVAQQGAAKKSD